MKNYKVLATAIQSYKKSLDRGNTKWADRWGEAIEKVMESAPSGSGLDAGVELDLEKRGLNKLVFHTAFHHMNGCGSYD